MNNKGLGKSILFFIISLVILATSVFAWFSISNQNRIGTIIAHTADFSAEISFDVKKNDATEYMEIDSIEDMHAAFGYTLPGDTLHFKIYLVNDGTKDFTANIEIKNILSNFQNNSKILDPNYEANMLDVYYLLNGEIKITKIIDEETITTYEYLDKKSEEEVILFEGTAYETRLEPYRFSNIIDEVNNLKIISSQSLSIGHEMIVEFSIGYDKNTSYPDYEYGEFHLNSIYVYLS